MTSIVNIISLNKSMPNALKIATGLLLASIIAIFFNMPRIYLFLKINDLLLIGSLTFFTIAIFKREIAIQQNKKFYYFVVVWFGINVLGTIINFIMFKHLPVLPILREYAHMLASFLIFFEIITIARDNHNFLKWTLWGLMIPSIILPIIYFIPLNYMHYLEYMPGTYARFMGLFENPNYYALFMIIPIILLLSFLTKPREYNKRSIALITIGFFIFCLSIGTTIWCGSRAGIISLITSLIVFMFFFSRYNTIKKTIIIVLLIILAFPIGYFILPNNNTVHQQIASRIYSIRTFGGDGITKETSFFMGAQDRSKIWKNSFTHIVKNPLGYGPGGYLNLNIVDSYGTNYESHNTILQILLAGGIFLLFLIGIALSKFIHDAFVNCQRQFTEGHALLAIFVGIIIYSLFSDTLYVRWIWVILALIYSYTYSFPNSQLSKDN